MNRIDELKRQYKLTEEDNEKIFIEQIKPQVFSKEYKPSDNPIAIICGGQSGSGKVAAMSEAKKEHKDATIITTDDYKPHHPQSEHLKKTYPIEYIPIVDQDAGIWTGKCLKEAINNKYSFIFEGTLKNTRILKRLEECKNQGFTVEVKVMATSNIESLLSVFERYEKEVEVIGNGRMVSVKQHNDAYYNVPDTVKAIEESPFCDIITVYGRGESPTTPRLVYSSVQNNNIYNSAFDALNGEREKNKQKVLPTVDERLESLTTKMQRGINQTEYENFASLLNELSKTTNKDYKEVLENIGKKKQNKM